MAASRAAASCSAVGGAGADGAAAGGAGATGGLVDDVLDDDGVGAGTTAGAAGSVTGGADGSDVCGGVDPRAGSRLSTAEPAGGGGNAFGRVASAGLSACVFSANVAASRRVVSFCAAI